MPETSRRIIQLSPEADTLPEGLLLPPEQGGEVVAFVVEPDVADWAGRALVRLARGWTERHRQVILVEGDFAGPFLQAATGATASEGVADALHFGASPERIVSDVPGERFGFVPAGTVVPDPAQAWAHEGWPHLLRTLSEGRVVLLVLPADREGAGDLASRADRVFRMSASLPGPDAPHPVIHPPGAVQGAGNFAAPSGPPVPADSGSPGADPANEGSRIEGMIRPDQDTLAERQEYPAPTGKRKRGRGGDGAAGAPGTGRRSKGGPGRLVLLLVIVVVLALLLIGAGALGWVDLPGFGLSEPTMESLLALHAPPGPVG